MRRRISGAALAAAVLAALAATPAPALAHGAAPITQPNALTGTYGGIQASTAFDPLASVDHGRPVADTRAFTVDAT